MEEDQKNSDKETPAKIKKPINLNLTKKDQINYYMQKNTTKIWIWTVFWQSKTKHGKHNPPTQIEDTTIKIIQTSKTQG